MGEQGGLRTGLLAAFGTEGYDGEPPLLEELGVNFGHVMTKVRCIFQHQSPKLEYTLEGLWSTRLISSPRHSQYSTP
jgi:hypothetical protein